MAQYRIPGGMEYDSDSSDDLTFNVPKPKGPGWTCPPRPSPGPSRVNEKLPSSKQRRQIAYVESKKKEAKLGVIVPPQKIYPKFAANRVGKNLKGPALLNGPIALMGKHDLERIMEDNTTKLLPAKIQRQPVLIDSLEGLKKLQDDLKSHNVLSIDFEGNETHSYLGMTSLVQISVLEKDYILDPFPHFASVRGLLQEILSDASKLKVFCGATNDFRWIQRDFDVRPASVLDLQELDKLTNRSTGNPLGLQALTKKYIGSDLPKAETMRDWRRRPLTKELLDYAQADSYYTLAIFQRIQRQLLQENRQSVIVQAMRNTSKISEILFDYVHTEKTYLQKAETEASSLPTNQKDLFDIITQWNLTTAKLLDQRPARVIPFEIMKTLAIQRPQSTEELKNLVGTRLNHLGNYIVGLIRVLPTAEFFFAKTVCRNCGVFGHSAKMCIAVKSSEAKKIYYAHKPGQKKIDKKRARENYKRNKRARKESKLL